MIATCPVHQDQDFIRDEQCAWWRCRACHPDASPYVIPDELVTPDGGDVIQWATDFDRFGSAAIVPVVAYIRPHP